MAASCERHPKAYQPGCEYCQAKQRERYVRRNVEKKLPAHQRPGRPTQDWGIRSPAMWAKFHEICKRLGLQ